MFALLPSKFIIRASLLHTIRLYFKIIPPWDFKSVVFWWPLKSAHSSPMEMWCFKFHSVNQDNAARSHFNRIGHAPSLQTECVTQVFEAAGVTNAINTMTRSARVEIKNDLGFNSLSDTLSHGCFICRALNAKSEAEICDRVDSTDSKSAQLFFFWNQYLINETEMTRRICTWLSQKTFFIKRCVECDCFSNRGHSALFLLSPVTLVQASAKLFPASFCFIITFPFFFYSSASHLSAGYKMPPMPFSPEYHPLTFPLTVSFPSFLYRQLQ